MGKLNIVAIIGRPNIGKSTLFNRITKTKTSIVSDQSGVTRDRIYRNVDWNSRRFTLVDTGGMVPDSGDYFEERIRDQAQIAVDEADSIIFLMDVKTGITTIDHDIAKFLKRSNKKITLVINKVDDERWENDSYEFYSLGLGDPIPISAMNGRNIGNMLDIVTEDFKTFDYNDEVEEEEDDGKLKIAVLGRPNAGKSSLVNAFLNQDKMIVSDIPGTTRDSVDSFMRYKKKEVVLIDTAGLRRKTKVKDDLEFYSTVRTLKAIDRCDVAILMVDVEIGLTTQDITIIQEIISQLKGIIIAVNKWDTVEDKHSKIVKEYEEALRYHIEWIKYVPIKFISVLEKQRLYKLLDLAIDIKDERSKKIPTNVLMDYFVPIIRKTPPASIMGRFVKITFISQVAVNPPVFVFFCNYPEALKDNYKKFLERKLREKFNFQGLPLKIKFKSKYSEQEK
ncbi:MAG: ribosome biogenesis GTPase Der [Candidatus Cloacimonadota bacterium]|nr:MAG: ribosome biogenesis GTPase Der [Candidatus Cloacimonadota bacterium]PIE81397.1 MAG: ribosome biogenesis GTPase Der [Candidatus Delongbacteria bacterium]